ncbi:MAG TPA: DUF1161 domain-containing protein [Burkholderiaceae bacterium]|nr:DUF1161 domain-containing protein [Burkholderiaceae bacterium]
MSRLHSALIALLVGSPQSYAGNNCDGIRTHIDAKVRAAGVDRFVLSVVDAQAKVDGKVVGTCDLGSKKIIYRQLDGPEPEHIETGPREERILTECRDGSVTYGDCRK